MKHLCVLAAALCAACGAPAVQAAGADASLIQPIPGLVLTVTIHSSFNSISADTAHSYPVLDSENFWSIEAATPEEIRYKIRVTAPNNQQAAVDARRFVIVRRVRREDMAQSSRMTLLYSTADPDIYAGQTFAETSTHALGTLKSGAELPFVAGIDFEDGMWDTLAAQAAKATSAGTAASNSPLSPSMLGGAFAMLGNGRAYYRGPLHRVEPGTVPFSVLLNGERTTLPAVHAAGSFTASGQPPMQAEFWWLDNATYPLTLRWAFGRTASLVTHIDIPAAHNPMAAMVADSHVCRAELSGLYFNTGSAQLLEESQPTLKAVAEAVKGMKGQVLTIEGHTDNIGSAAYNQDLSEKRAQAVRQALLTQYAVPPAQLTAKGYGLTRPVETNATLEGRAHNRRVELARSCAGA